MADQFQKIGFISPQITNQNTGNVLNDSDVSQLRIFNMIYFHDKLCIAWKMVKSRKISEIENVSLGFRIWPAANRLLCDGRLKRSIRLSPSIIYEAFKSKHQFRDLPRNHTWPDNISHGILKLFILFVIFATFWFIG